MLIKILLMKTLRSSFREVRCAASKALARIVLVEVGARKVQGTNQDEVRVDEWPRIIDELVLPNQPESLKLTILETIQFICEELSSCCHDLAPAQVNSIFTLIAQEINGASPEICLAAAMALSAALPLAKFKRSDIMEFKKIMEVVAEKTLAEVAEFRRIAVQCLCKAYPSFSDMLKPYIDVIFKLMMNTFKEDRDVISRLFEFLPEMCNLLNKYLWCKVGDHTSETYYNRISSGLVLMFLETFLKLHEDHDQDEGIWKHTECCGTFLQLAAKCLKDAIVPPLEQFIERKLHNISKHCWRSRRAVIHVIGLMMEGPSIESLSTVVGLGFDFILDTMREKSCHAKDTVAWTLSPIFEFFHCPRTIDCSLATPENLVLFVDVLLEWLKDPPYISQKVCRAVYFLARGCEDGGVDASMFAHSLVTGLMEAGDRDDANDSQLVLCVYKALKEVIRCLVFEDNYEVIVTILPTIISRLTNTTQIQVREADIWVKQGELQASLCGVLHLIIRRLGGSRKTNHLILKDANQIFELIDMIFSCAVDDEALLAVVGEDALMVVGALVYASGQKSGNHVEDVWKYVKAGLKDYHSQQIYLSSISVIGDICGAFGDEALPLYNEIMTIFYSDLSSDGLPRSLRSSIFSCVGDIALASGVYFEKYLCFVVQRMEDAAIECSSSGEEEMVEFGVEMSLNILKTYSAICQGFKNTDANLIMPYVFGWLEFMRLTVENQSRNVGVIKAAVAVLGDISDTIGSEYRRCQDHANWIYSFLDTCLESDNKDLRKIAEQTSMKLPPDWVGRQWLHKIGV